MILIITPENRRSYAKYLEEMHRVRYEVFVERCGWKNLANETQTDIDEFDQPWVTYYLKLSSEGKILAGLRTLPTNHPYMINKIYYPKFRDQFNIARLPHSEHVWEMSRYFVLDPDYRTETGHAAKMELYVAVFEHALACGVKSLCAVGETYIMARAIRLGWKIQPISVPFEHNEVDFEGEMLAINLAVNEQMVAKTRSAWNLHHELIMDELNPIDTQIDDIRCPVSSDIDQVYDKLSGVNASVALRLLTLLNELASGDFERRDRAEKHLDSWIAMEASRERMRQKNMLQDESTLN